MCHGPTFHVEQRFDGVGDLRTRPLMIQVSHAQIKGNAATTVIDVGATPLLI